MNALPSKPKKKGPRALRQEELTRGYAKEVASQLDAGLSHYDAIILARLALQLPEGGADRVALEAVIRDGRREGLTDAQVAFVKKLTGVAGG